MWYAQNGLCINPSKTESILFSTSKRLLALQSDGLNTVSVSTSVIPISSSIISLGVNIDSSLTLSNQVKAIVKSCNYNIIAIKHIRHLLTFQDASSIATSLVQSKLDYCNSLLSNTSVVNMRSLQRVQNNLARLVLQPSKPTPSVALLRTLHWLPVRHRISYKVACLTHASLRTSQPAYLNDLIQPYKPVRSLRSSDQHLLIVPRTRLSLTQQSFQVAAPNIWNSLPLSLRLITDTTQFRNALKTHLFGICVKEH